MNIALIGATGFIGSGLLKEALARGHVVTALVSRPERLAEHANVAALKTDVQDTAALAEQLKGFDAVLSAFSGHAEADTYDYYVAGVRSIVAAAKQASVPRLLVVGGAGSLEVAPGVQGVDTPDFPEQWKASALGAREALNLLREEKELDWTLLSPSALIAPGERTGTFRLGTNQLLIDADGKSAISVEDYAVALIDELEKPAHPRQRFTVGY
ncbi:NAD(P)-dependent oxidoreductase [Crenobacter cavernae]|uniref:NAD(P)-dependent oxidoreductase n=1 Tax=Crenobacter cavernae TaxID=2290923 RepID=A0A345Y7H6_9NEIS|nr:NAD(P)-dependent oxidoreductase [Crenobacter cavernae]AXK39878.1 NAD(P)-dependent oxidoreductase [Crenobacter cavernae]